jgi:hypothetical protein
VTRTRLGQFRGPRFEILKGGLEPRNEAELRTGQVGTQGQEPKLGQGPRPGPKNSGQGVALKVRDWGGWEFETQIQGGVGRFRCQECTGPRWEPGLGGGTG